MTEYSRNNLLNSNWQRLVNKGLIMYSPTYDSNSSACERKGVLSTMDSESQIHFDYGHAFGSAAGALFRNSNEDRSLRLGKALLHCAPYSKRFWDLETHYGNKTMYRLLEGILDVDIHAQDLMRSHTVYGEEEKVILRVFKDDNFFEAGDYPYYMGGTYDIALKGKGTNQVNIHDFKAINSQFMYSFITDMQIPFYTTINQLKNNVLVKTTASEEPIDFQVNNNYLVHQTGNRAENFERKPLRPEAIANGLVSYMQSAMRKAKKLTALGKVQDLYSAIDDTEFNYHHCSRGGYDCRYLDQCQTTPPKYKAIENLFDDREPTSIVTVDVTEEDIIKTSKAIAYKAVLAIESRENFMTMDLSDVDNTVIDPNLSDVSKDIDALFDAM